MNILHISGAKVWGGNEQQLILNVNELNNLGSKNYIFGIDNSPLHLSATNNNINFIPSFSKKISKFSNISQLKKIISDYKIDVIHLHTSDSLTLFYIFNLVNKVKPKIIYSKKAVRASSSFFSKFKYNSKRLDIILCVSKKVKTDMINILNPVSQKKLQIVYDCISTNSKQEVFDTSSFKNKYNLQPSTYLIGSIANHTSAKDLPNLIQAIYLLKNKYHLKDFKLIQIGDFSKLTPELELLIEKLELKNEIILTGKIENAMSINPILDIFIVSSSREGGPTAALEAMLLKTNIVTTDVGIMSEIIYNNKNGFICQPKNSEELAKSIFEAYTTPKDKLNEMKDFNYKLVAENFNSKKSAQKLIEIYSSKI
ncbi:glycosyltransferase [Empedobacter falsenii]